MRKPFSACLVMVFALGLSANAFAGAQIQGVSGQVMVNTGAGYRAVTETTNLKAGDRVMIAPKAGATLRFDDGCTIPVSPGRVITVGSKSPCTFKAQTFGNFDGFNPEMLVGGALGLGVTGLFIKSLAQGKDKVTSP